MRKKKSGSDFRGKGREQNVDYSTGKNDNPGRGKPGSFTGHSEHNLERPDNSKVKTGSKSNRTGRRGY